MHTLVATTVPHTILVLEDEPTLLYLVERVLLDSDAGYQVYTATTCKQALILAKQYPPHLFLFDYQLPDGSGLDLYDQLHVQARYASIPLLLVSADLPAPSLLEQKHITGVAKPYMIDTLLDTIAALLSDPSVEKTHVEDSIRR